MALQSALQACLMGSLASSLNRELPPRDYAGKFVVKNMTTLMPKGLPSGVDLLSDPSNLFVPRCKHAGRIVYDESGVPHMVMHQGVVVSKEGYYGIGQKIVAENSSDLILANLGLHEPGEERLFSEVLRLMPRGAVMLELGAYWAYYSTWFGAAVPDARLLAVEGEPAHMAVGEHNLEINNQSARWWRAFVSCGWSPGNYGAGNCKTEVVVSQLLVDLKLQHVDLLLADIQGSEWKMIKDIKDVLKARRVSYLFISTHKGFLHAGCKEVLSSVGYRIIASVDIDECSWAGDGVIVACPKELKAVPPVDLGCRARAPERRNSVFENVPFSGEPCPYLPHRWKQLLQHQEGHSHKRVG